MLNQVLQNLPDEDRRALMIAFEGEFTQIVNLPDNKFIGVNVKLSPNQIALETKGVWIYGEVRS